jgi:signal transduction histidine kinase/ketosteroid isomerase-like protein
VKLSQQKESEILQAYETYFDSYIKGDTHAIEILLVDDYNQIGSAESEVFFNKRDALKFLHDTIDQVAGKTEMRNRTIKIDSLKDSVLVTDLFDIYVLVEEDWTFYSKFRASTLMQEIDGHWKFIHQHSSVPDLKAREGENIAIEKVSKENLELRNAIKRRTVELEQKNRELEIEAALERVRTKTMAMHNSDDVGVTVVTLFDEVLKLGLDKSIRCGIGILDKETDHMETWSATSYPDGKVDLRMGLLDMRIHPMLVGLKKAWDNHKSGYQYDYIGDDVLKYYKALNNEPKYPFHKDLNSLPENEYHRSFFYSEGILFAFAPNPISEESARVLNRFAGVFGQTYRRYLDLKNAEAQAKEALIEVSLERVRVRAMAMRESSELSEVISTVFLELTKLDIRLTRTMLWIFDENPDELEVWMANSEVEKTPESLRMAVTHPYHKRIFNSWKKRKTKWVYVLKGDEKRQLDDFLFKNTIAAQLPDSVKDGIRAPEKIINSFSFHNFGGLQADGLEELTEENLDILYRFSKEFDLTYTRFQDLQKAEAQTKEAQIEAALERVRSRTMGMQHSGELIEAANLLFRQVRDMGVNLWSAGYGTWHKDKKATTLWMSSEDVIQKPFTYPHTEDPVSIRFSQAGEKGESLYVEEMGGEALKSHYEYMRKLPMVGEMLEDILKAGFDVPAFQVFHVAYFSYGYLLFITYEPCQEAHSVFKRFAKVFEQTYTRFLDLQKAEAQAKEAVKQSSLDRIRAEIASMRTTDDLNRITPLIWRELTTLDVPFFRCGVFIVDDDVKNINVFLSNPSGDSLAAWNTEYESIPLFKATVDHWKKQLVYREEWNQKQFIQFMKSLIEHGLIDDQDNFQSGRDAPDYLALQMVPFEQGMLYVGSSEKLDKEQIELVQSLADSFSVAYARYEDFKKLEEAKGRAENTLTDLRAAQNQLIQSEKMASLGELTAGIAHEIQNPLNFVNNLSELNKELAEELNEELEKGNMEEVKDIAQDIIQNEQKISHHGKRAEAIVKGMLQHSRTSTGKKELTDINILADEYLRLAYHGLRAKDKSFNADFNLEIDENIPEIKVIPQDLGRVLLNLINNAFYAVDKKAKEGIEGYKPIVTVSLVNMDDKIEIEVKDNGNGIPENLKEKIFQPFFTTKPTGHGTGLGLSLTYDIIKAHGGEINVVNKEGEGANFKISLIKN